MTDVVKVERVGGGIVPFGAANARIKGEGECAVADLSAADKATLDALFQAPPAPAGSPAPRLKLTRTEDGKTRSVEVAETAVPASLQRCIHDRLL